MTSASNMISRLETIKRQCYQYSLDEVAMIEQLALLDEILEALRGIRQELNGIKNRTTSDVI